MRSVHFLRWLALPESWRKPQVDVDPNTGYPAAALMGPQAAEATGKFDQQSWTLTQAAHAWLLKAKLCSTTATRNRSEGIAQGLMLAAQILQQQEDR